MSRISPKKTRSSDAVEVIETIQGVDPDRFFQSVVERRISDAEKELDTIRTTIPATDTAKGYLKALEGLLLTAKSPDDKYLYLPRIEKTPSKLRELNKEFAAQASSRLHTDYDRGYFQALQVYVKKLERSVGAAVPKEPEEPKPKAVRAKPSRKTKARKR